MDTPGLEDLPSMSDELPLAGCCQPSPVESQTKGASKPHSDLDIAMTTLSSSSRIFQKLSLVMILSEPIQVLHVRFPYLLIRKKSFPTRTNWGPLIYLRDCELKREH